MTDNSQYTPEWFAKLLDGREIYHEIAPAEEKLAKNVGIIIIFGYSDDCIECRGQVDDELGCFDGGDFWISRNGIRPFENGELPLPVNDKGEWFLSAVWCDREVGASWSYKTKAPHATFDIMEDGELFCRGIVMKL